MIPFRSNLVATAVAATSVGLAMAGPADAHATLKSAEPPANARVTGSPKLVQLHFTEPLEPKFSHVAIIGAGGMALAFNAAKPADASSLVATPKAPLAPGVYTVNWISVAADDGHKMSGSYVFTVK